MGAKKKHYPLIVSTIKENPANAITDLISNQNEDIPNKYLYFSYQGAYLWNKIDLEYKPGKDCSELLKLHFKEIDEHICSNGNTSYDIVSLGTGSGADDVLILNIIQKSLNKGKNRAPFRLFAVDFSLILLNDGIRFIVDFLNNKASDRLSKCIKCVRGIWGDFETLSKTKLEENGVNFSNIEKRPTLYHLLGLTLGNNKEAILLRSFHEIMVENDYLLLGVDFSADSEESLQKSFQQYIDAAALINPWLCNPLHFVCKHNKVSDSNYAHKTDFEIVKIEHKNNDYKRISQVNNARSFTRYHDYGSGALRLCDYSTKYNSKDFVEFIINLKEEQVFFNIEHIFEHKKQGAEELDSHQVLVLLKKKKAGEEKEKTIEDSGKKEPSGQQNSKNHGLGTKA